MTGTNRSIAFWVFMVFLSLSLILLLIGQTMAVFNYDFAVSLGLQEDVKEVSEFGVEINRAFGVGDTIIYIPLILLSIAGLILKKRWALISTAAVMGITAYWATTVVFMFWFLVGVPSYSFVPGAEYWVVISFYIIMGVGGIIYLMLRGENLIR
jgi:hypothetical protein